MKYSPLILIFIVILITCSFFSIASASCSSEKKLIFYEAVNKQVKDILKDIENEIKYKILFEDIELFKNKITIEFNEVPLDEVFHRLLKKQNYSVICDDKEKNITLVVYEKSKGDAADRLLERVEETSHGVPTASENQGVMAGVLDAFEEYNGGKVHAAGPVLPAEETEMSGATIALGEYSTNTNNQKNSLQDVVETEMSGVTIAVEEYNLNKNKQVLSNSSQGENFVDSKGGSAVAFMEYERNVNYQTSLLPHPQETEMDGVSAALDEYKLKHLK